MEIIVNPAAGRGSGERLLPRIRSLFSESPNVTIASTRSPGDEERLTRSALSLGARQILVAGGDGTCSRVANVILSAGSDCRLGVFACGTGNDFAKTLGVSDYSPEQLAALASRADEARIDVGSVHEQYFLNSCGFGFDASVLEASNRVRFLKGDAVYIYSALKQLFTYPGISVSSSGHPARKRERMLMVTVSNGRSLGGAFRIAPHASVLDGKLDACFFGDANVVNRARLFLGALKGRHIGMPGVVAASTERLELSFELNPAMEVDGELRIARSRTVELKCVPRALAVIAAPGALV